MVGTSDRSCSLVGEGSTHLGLSLHAGQAFSESRTLRMSVICPGQGCRESVQLITGQFPVTQVSSPHRGPAGDRCRSSYECALPFLSYHLSCDVACLPAVWRAPALPWGGIPLPAPLVLRPRRSMEPASPSVVFLCFLTREREDQRTGRRRAEAKEAGSLPLPGRLLGGASCLLLAGGGLRAHR